MSLNSIEVFFTKLADYIRQVFHVKVYSDVDFSGLFVNTLGKAVIYCWNWTRTVKSILDVQSSNLDVYIVFGDSRRQELDTLSTLQWMCSVCYGLEQSDPGLVSSLPSADQFSSLG